MRPLLIGQAPGPRSNVKCPLWPQPSRSAGGRLAALAGLRAIEYLRAFDRANLLYQFPGAMPKSCQGDKWPLTTARTAAKAIQQLFMGRTVIFVGRNVAKAFGEREATAPLFTWFKQGSMRYQWAVIPHTSGVSRAYNDPAQKAEASAVLTQALDPEFRQPVEDWASEGFIFWRN